ncbi:hypothetical protein [Nocardioides montaniterrae]
MSDSIAGTTAAPSRNAGAGIRRAGALLWRRRWVALLTFAAVANAVAAGLVVAPREYTASAQVEAAFNHALAPDAGTYQDLVGTVAHNASSRPLLEAVAAQVGGRTAPQLAGEVHAAVLPGTVVVKIEVTDADPDRAARIANAVAAAVKDDDPSNGAFGLKVSETSIPPEHPSAPNIRLLGLLGGLLALVCALAAAALTDRMFRTVGDPEELGAVTGLPVLGVIPRPSDADGIPAADPEADEFQALRALRVAVEFASAERPSRLLVVASASQDPWAGWLAVNTASALGEVGHRVLLVNADRDRRVHPALDVPGEDGLYDVLAGSRDLAEVIRVGLHPQVDLVPLGHAHLATPSLLEMRFRGLLDEAEDEYDVVVVHAAAVSASEDARIMAIHGAMLLTVVAGRANPRHLRRAADHLRMIKLRLLGTVLIGTRSVHQRRRPIRLTPSVLEDIPKVSGRGTSE